VEVRLVAVLHRPARRRELGVDARAGRAARGGAERPSSYCSCDPWLASHCDRTEPPTSG
jgi:hypothetical protein